MPLSSTVHTNLHGGVVQLLTGVATAAAVRMEAAVLPLKVKKPPIRSFFISSFPFPIMCFTETKLDMTNINQHITAGALWQERGTEK